MSSTTFDFASVVRDGLPPPASKWQSFPEHNFVGGHNAPESIPVDDLIATASAVLAREGRTLATYSLESGPQGYRPLREFLAEKLFKQAQISCTADNILMTSGSLQAIDLVNQVMLSDGDTVIVEEASYGGVFSRLQRLGVTAVGVPGDRDGIDMAALGNTLERLAADGATPKYIYTIPTIQNPTATIMSLERRHRLIELAKQFGVAIFEDECYSDLIWDGQRPPAIYALDDSARTIFVGSFSKSIAPALRVGYVVAPWPFLSQVLACKTDAGSGALEQMVLAEYCVKHFDQHVAKLNALLKTKLDALVESINEHFGTTAEFEVPPGGIFLWIKLPPEVDTTKLAQVAASEGVEINPGDAWSIEGDGARRSLRICYANPPLDKIRKGVAKLAEICNREFGVPTHISNVQQQ